MIFFICGLQKITSNIIHTEFHATQIFSQNIDQFDKHKIRLKTHVSVILNCCKYGLKNAKIR